MLSDEKIKGLAEKMPRGFLWSEGCEWESGVLIQEATEFARVIEAAVLAELAKEPPACEVHSYHLRAAEDGGHWCREPLLYSGNNPGDLDHGRVPRVKLYLHPAPAPEGMVMVPRKMTVAVGCAWKDATDAGATLQEMWDAMIAAAEKEHG